MLILTRGLLSWLNFPLFPRLADKSIDKMVSFSLSTNTDGRIFGCLIKKIVWMPFNKLFFFFLQ